MSLEICGEIPESKKYEIRLDVTFEREMTYGEAEKKIMDALRTIGMKSHCGEIR